MLRKKLLNAVEHYQTGLETTEGVANAKRSTVREGVLSSVSVKLFKASDWDAAEKIRGFIEINLDGRDDFSTICAMYPKIKNNHFGLHAGLLAAMTRTITDSLNLDHGRVDRAVQGMQLANLGAQSSALFFGVATDMDAIEVSTRLKFIEEKFPILMAKPGDEIEMKNVGGYKL